MSRTVHVVGAGLAGLSTALAATQRGARVQIYEGATQAGGRCRSFFDDKLDRQIDNGNHLVLTGNTSVQRYLKRAGAPDALVAAPKADFPFADVKTGERWTVRMNDGPIPWWPFAQDRRPKRVGLAQMAGAGRILFAGPNDTIGGLVKAKGLALTRFWEPMSYAVMNLPPAEASAQLMRATALEAWRDGRLARPMFAPNGLGPALVDPAVKALEAASSPVRFGEVLKEVERADGRISAL
ncbi:MAG: FAD-dependent oxidoreductase, partial [Pseudomonadota bacterium]